MEQYIGQYTTDIFVFLLCASVNKYCRNSLSWLLELNGFCTNPLPNLKDMIVLGTTITKVVVFSQTMKVQPYNMTRMWLLMIQWQCCILMVVPRKMKKVCTPYIFLKGNSYIPAIITQILSYR